MADTVGNGSNKCRNEPVMSAHSCEVSLPVVRVRLDLWAVMWDVQMTYGQRIREEFS